MSLLHRLLPRLFTRQNAFVKPSSIPPTTPLPRPKIYRPACFYRSDVSDAAHKLWLLSQEYHPEFREEFIRDAAQEAIASLSQ